MGNGEGLANGVQRGSRVIQSHRDLDVWQEGMAVAEMCYALTHSFPREEIFGMTSQIRRAATSVPANIAEGYGRDNRGDYVHHLRIAQGSLKELETHLELACRVGLAPQAAVTPILQRTDRAGRMLRALYRSLQST